MDDTDEIFRYAAGGFRDFTRIASSNPAMWRDICVANSDPLAGLVEGFAEEMQQLANAIRNKDAETLDEIFTNAKTTRDRFIDGTE